jgi:hypothetical protein
MTGSGQINSSPETSSKARRPLDLYATRSHALKQSKSQFTRNSKSQFTDLINEWTDNLTINYKTNVARLRQEEGILSNSLNLLYRYLSNDAQ